MTRSNFSLLVLGLAACGYESTNETTQAGQGAIAGEVAPAGRNAPAGQLGAGQGPSAGASGSGPSQGGAAAGLPALPMVNDRCLGSGCAPVALPQQPDLTFLEDMGDGWKRLMEADWAMSPQSEGYRCMTLTIPEDVYITAFAPQSPQGTHHATFGVTETPQGPDEVVECGVGAGGDRRLQGSGAGSEPSQLPPGVAMRLSKGQQVMMNLHLFNVTEQPLEGRSGMWVKIASKSEVDFEAETILAGPLSLRVPPGRSTQKGGCTLDDAATIYGVGPHMHQLGVYVRIVAEQASGETLMYEGDYDFSHQLFYDIDPISLKAGDRVRIECTYENDTSRTVSWGDSSLDEMCFVGLGLYPAMGYGGLPCSG